MADSQALDPPSAFVMDWIERLFPSRPSLDVARGALSDSRSSHRLRALDVAMGRGRHAIALGQRGFDAYGVDRRLDAVADAVRRARAAGVDLHAWCADLTAYPLPSKWFALIVVTRYLQRDLFESLEQALMPGGVLLYETFTEKQLAFGRGPTSPDHLLAPGELRSRVPGLEVVHFEEVEESEAVARLVARRAPSFSRA